MREVGIGIAGFGVVGGGVLSILRQHADDIEARLGARIVVRRVAVRDPEKERAVELDPGLVTTRIEDLLEDPGIAVVVELMGGVEQPLQLVRGARARGQHVVTAHKARLAARGAGILGLGRRAGVAV